MRSPEIVAWVVEILHAFDQRPSMEEAEALQQIRELIAEGKKPTWADTKRYYRARI